MEKLGVSNEQLLIELQAEYAALQEKVQGQMTKTGAVSNDTLEQLTAVKARIEELQTQ